ncbi:MAG TPA: hypothetical protein VIY71_10525 [Solirubrobacterales bacterium]
MTAPPRTTDVPANRLVDGDFLAGIDENDLVHFVLNVGDGDTQIVLLPAEAGKRRAIVVDVCSARKLDHLIAALQEAKLLPADEEPLALVVATHPHADHISGMASFITKHADLIGEVWEPGYFIPTKSYFTMMDALAKLDLDHTQPSSGTVRFIDQVKVTVLAPGVSLKNRYDSYGIDPNNSSIALKLDFPARRYYARNDDGSVEKLPDGASLVLGADAQTLSWAQVFVDFPQLAAEKTAVAEALNKARGVNHLKANVFKVPHHASKHGLNLELIEEIKPAVSLVSSVGGGGSYNFPHRVSLEALREGLEQTTKKEKPRSDDFDLGIHFTFGKDTANRDLGSIAVVLGPTGRKHDVWRFGDGSSKDIDLTSARKFG